MYTLGKQQNTTEYFKKQYTLANFRNVIFHY
jgi:hypothetical protein